jgi:hypothetical protein
MQVYRKVEVSTWQLWFAWRPVKTLGGERIWSKRIYRRSINSYVDFDNWQRYEYGTLFDVLKNE